MPEATSFTRLDPEDLFRIDTRLRYPGKLREGRTYQKPHGEIFTRSTYVDGTIAEQCTSRFAVIDITGNHLVLLPEEDFPVFKVCRTHENLLKES